MIDDGVLVLGQDQDALGDGFEADQAFSGELTQFNIWDRVLTQDEIEPIAKWVYKEYFLLCCSRENYNCIYRSTVLFFIHSEQRSDLRYETRWTDLAGFE